MNHGKCKVRIMTFGNLGYNMIQSENSRHVSLTHHVVHQSSGESMNPQSWTVWLSITFQDEIRVFIATNVKRVMDGCSCPNSCGFHKPTMFFSYWFCKPILIGTGKNMFQKTCSCNVGWFWIFSVLWLICSLYMFHVETSRQLQEPKLPTERTPDLLSLQRWKHSEGSWRWSNGSFRWSKGKKNGKQKKREKTMVFMLSSGQPSVKFSVKSTVVLPNSSRVSSTFS